MGRLVLRHRLHTSGARWAPMPALPAANVTFLDPSGQLRELERSQPFLFEGKIIPLINGNQDESSLFMIYGQFSALFYQSYNLGPLWDKPHLACGSNPGSHCPVWLKPSWLPLWDVDICGPCMTMSYSYGIPILESPKKSIGFPSSR